MSGDIRLVAASFVAVATSPAMSGWADYVRLVEGARPQAWPQGVARIRPFGAPARIVASLVSFCDDHDRPLPMEVLPRAGSLTLIRAFASSDRLLAVPDQWRLAVGCVPDPWEALLSLHLAVRQLARGRDTRALGPAAPASVAERCGIGRCIAPFDPAISQGGDPLGDTYHYWANVIAGVLAAHLGGVRGRAIEELFRAGPFLMRSVRERIFGSRLFYGDHRHVDRLGLTHGLALGGRR